MYDLKGESLYKSGELVFTNGACGNIMDITGFRYGKSGIVAALSKDALSLFKMIEKVD